MPAIILVADDDADLLRLLTLTLQLGGHAIVQARDGMEALAAAARLDPDLIVADIQMPGLSGLALTTLLRGDGDHGPPILLVSGLVHPTTMPSRCTFLAKPFAADRLLREVAALLA